MEIANNIFEQCCFTIEVTKRNVWSKANTQQAIGWDNKVSIGQFPNNDGGYWKPTRDVDRLTDRQQSGRIYAYYVSALQVNGEWGGPRGVAFWQGTFSSPPAPSVMIANKALGDTLAHEIGHILLDSGLHSELQLGARNLMASGGVRVGSDLVESQCDKMREIGELLGLFK
jgi:hypothetical protein